MQAEGTPLLRIALVVAVLLSIVAIHRADGSWETARDKRIAEAAAVQAVADAQAAKAQLEQLMRELDDLDDKVSRAMHMVSGAENDADRAAAEARLEQLRHEQYELTKRVRSLRALARGRDRCKCLCVPRQCIDNPLAKGCT